MASGGGSENQNGWLGQGSHFQSTAHTRVEERLHPIKQTFLTAKH